MLDILEAGVEVVPATVQGLLGLSRCSSARSFPGSSRCMGALGEFVAPVVGPSRLPINAAASETQCIRIRPTPREGYRWWATGVLFSVADIHVALCVALVETLSMDRQLLRDVVLQVRANGGRVNAVACWVEWSR
jgi:hypothetical protein